MSSAVILTCDQARALRLVRLGLAPQAPRAPTLNTPADVAAHHLAMQGQDFSAVQWALASRLLHQLPTPAQMLAAFDAGEIVRTWPMRGTIHVLATADSRWLLDLCGPVALRGVQRRWQNLGIDQQFVDTVRTVTQQLLGAGDAVSRDDLITACVAAGLDFSETQRRYHAIWYTCQQGDALLGPTNNGDHLLVGASHHAPNARRYDPDAEPAELVELAWRYLTAHSPASVDDLQHWTKLTKTQCTRAFAALGERIVPVHISGFNSAQLWSRAEDVTQVTELGFGDQVPRVHTLAAFDEHLLGYRDRSLVLDPALAHHVDPGRNGVFRHTVVLDGVVVGTWKKRLLKTTTPISVTLFHKVNKTDRARISQAFTAWGMYSQREPVVTFVSA